MSVLRTVAGVIAVLFSIQPLASWAADSGKKISNPSGGRTIEKQITIEKPGKGGKDVIMDANPVCGMGGTR